MSNLNPRIKRGNPSIERIKRGKHRAVLPDLLKDFEGRCAYSCQHVSKAGLKCMEVDYFDPNKKKDLIQGYDNLMLSTRHCNGAKGESWPTVGDQRLGIKFINPCEEMDYGVHIFEDSKTHELVGVTPAGKFQIRKCDLNAPHFVDERRTRSNIWKFLNQGPILVKNDYLDQACKMLMEQAEKMIPPFPYLPQPST